MRERGPVVTAKLAIVVASMRAAGVRVGIGDLIAAHRALGAVDPASRGDSYLALRAALCTRHSDYEVFDAAFEGAFGLRSFDPAPDPFELPDAARLVLPRMAVPPLPGEPRGEAPPPDLDTVPAAWSEVELLREKDFARMWGPERAGGGGRGGGTARRGPRRRSRGRRPARRRGAPPPGARSDLRGTVRASLRYAGEPVERHWREP